MLRLVLVATGLAAGAWLGCRPRRLQAAAGEVPAISIVVPARDEEATLPTLLATLAALDPKPHEVLVVDDASADRTAAVAAAHGATVLAAGERPDGWLGKPWACHVGAEAATGSHLLFLDADTWLAPDVLARVAATHRGGLLSVQPDHRPVAAYEQASLFPNLIGALSTGVAAPGLAMRGAFGPFLYTATTDYERVGGHAVVRDRSIEDLALADRYRAEALPVAGYLGCETVRYRMYPGGLGQLLEGWSKNLGAGAAGVGVVAPLAATAFVGALLAATTEPLLYAAAVVELRWLSRLVGRWRWWAIVAYPIPLVVFVGLFVRSGVRAVLRRPSTWRGREVPAR